MLADTQSIRILSSGIDTIELWWSWGISYNLPETFLNELTAARDQYRLDSTSSPMVDVENLCVTNPHVLASEPGCIGVFESARYRSVRHYSFALTFGDEAMILAFATPGKGSRRPGMNQVSVTINARYINSMGGDISGIISTLTAGLSSMVGSSPDLVRVSRVDLRSDIGSQAGLFKLEDLERFVSLARIRRPYLVGGDDGVSGMPPLSTPRGNTGASAYVPDGLPFAPKAMNEVEAALIGLKWSGFRFGSGDLLARIYSKTLEAVRKPHAKDYLNSLELIEGEHVTRVEFQLRSPVLAFFMLGEDCHDFRDWSVLEAHLPELWTYLTHWLTLRTPSTTDSNRWRWDLDPLWIMVQGSWGVSGNELRRAVPPPSVQIAQLVSQSVGCLLSAAAIFAHDVRELTLPIALHDLLRHHFRMPSSLLPAALTSDWTRVYSERFVRFTGLRYEPQRILDQKEEFMNLEVDESWNRRMKDGSVVKRLLTLTTL